MDKVISILEASEPISPAWIGFIAVLTTALIAAYVSIVNEKRRSTSERKNRVFDDLIGYLTELQMATRYDGSTKLTAIKAEMRLNQKVIIEKKIVLKLQKFKNSFSTEADFELAKREILDLTAEYVNSEIASQHKFIFF